MVDSVGVPVIVSSGEETPTSPSSVPELRSTSIQDVSDEVLNYIFSFLDIRQRIRMEVVCKRWQTVASKPTKLVLRTQFCKIRRVDDAIACSVLTHCGSTLKELTLKANSRLTGESLSRIGEFCPNLVSAEIHLMSGYQVMCLKAIAEVCVNLKVFRLNNYVNVPKYSSRSDNPNFPAMYRKNYYNACNRGLTAISQNCKSLECLYVSDLTHVVLYWLGMINPNLNTLSLHKACLSPDSMHCLLRRCLLIQRLTLDRCDPIDHSLLMEYLKIARHTLTVFKITLQGFEDDWREGLKLLINLEVLQLYLCDRIDDDLMEVLAENCPKLRWLDIGDTTVTDVGLIALKELPSLQELRIGRMVINSSSSISGRGIEALVSKGVLRQLTVLPRSVELESACRNLAVKYPAVRFYKEPLSCSCCWLELQTN